MIIPCLVTSISMKLFVSNVTCPSCSKLITDKITTVIGVSSCSVDIDEGSVTIEGQAINKQLLLTILSDLGYPEEIGE